MTQSQIAGVVLVGMLTALIFLGFLVVFSIAIVKRQKGSSIFYYWGILFVFLNVIHRLLILKPYRIGGHLETLFYQLNPEMIFFMWVLPIEPILILISCVKWFFIGALVSLGLKRLPFKINIGVMLIVGCVFTGTLINGYFGITDSWKEKNQLGELIDSGERVELTIQYYSEHIFSTKEGRKQKRITIYFNRDDSPWFLEEIWPEEAPSYKKGDRIKLYRKMVPYDKEGHQILKSTSVHNIKFIELTKESK